MIGDRSGENENCLLWPYFSAAGAGPLSLDAKRGTIPRCSRSKLAGTLTTLFNMRSRFEPRE
jgi:hypothetical protein